MPHPEKLITGILIPLIITVLLTSHTPAMAAEPNPEIKELTEKLGAEKYSDREKASTKLLKIGFPALPFLENAMKSSDPEVKTRAKALIRDIRLGIKPEWEDDLKNKLRKFKSLPPEERKSIIDAISLRTEEEALPFLISVVEAGGQNAPLALKNILRMENEAIWIKKTLDIKGKPTNPYVAELQAKAAMRSGNFKKTLTVLKSTSLKSQGKRFSVDFCMEFLKARIDDKEFAKAAEEAAELAETLPNEAPPLYIQAEALRKSGKVNLAEKIEKKALGLNPKEEAPHYTAGEFLMKRGSLPLAYKEWKKILDIPSEDDVYNINAYLRLSTIYAKSGLYAKALESLETALKHYKKAKKENGSSMGMVGADKIGAKLEYLRAKAEKKGDGDGTIKNVPPEYPDFLDANVKEIVKNGKMREMRKAIKNSAAGLSLKIQPRGIRLFKDKTLIPKYDKEKKRLEILLYGNPAASKNIDLGNNKNTTIYIFSLDTYYIYKYFPESGKIEFTNSFEKDYILRIRKKGPTRFWRNATIIIDGKKKTWKEMTEGIHFDYMPEKLDIKLKGTSPTGKPKNIDCSLKFE